MQSLPSPLETLIMCPPFPHGPQPTSSFPPSFPTAQAIVQLDYQFCFEQTILSPPFWYPSMDWWFYPLPFYLMCTRHSITCKFQSVLFLTDSQSALSILSSAPSYQLPGVPLECLVPRLLPLQQHPLCFQWVPGHAGSPSNETADLLAKAGAYAHWRDPMPYPSSHCQNTLFSVPQLKTSHLPRLYEPPSPRSLLGGTSPFSPYLLWASPFSLPWPQSTFIFISSRDQ